LLYTGAAAGDQADYFAAAINDFSAVDTRRIEGLRDRRDLRRTDSQLTNQRQSAMSAVWWMQR